MKVTRIGLDIAKQTFELHGVDQRGRAVLRKTLKRERMLEYFTQLEPCEVALEACGGARYWHRGLSKLGHTVRLVPANKVKPYVDGNKNNAHDAAAICEASSRPSMRFVERKTENKPFAHLMKSNLWPQPESQKRSKCSCKLAGSIYGRTATNCLSDLSVANLSTTSLCSARRTCAVS
jgi:hypothetical protein